MADRYIVFVNSPAGRHLVGAVDPPSPLHLERWQAGQVRPVDGPLVIGESGVLAEAILPFTGKLTDVVFIVVEGQFELPRWIAEHSPRAKAVLFDASGLTRFEQLAAPRNFFQPVLKGSDKCSRTVVLGHAPESLKDPVAANMQCSPEGFARSLDKEIRRGGNVQLLYVGKGAEDQLEGVLRFFLSPKIVCVSGQVTRLAVNSTQAHDWSKPLAGQRALVTDAARGTGAATTETLACDGVEVVLLDVPLAREALEGLAARLGGHIVALDIYATDAGQQLMGALLEGVSIVVHDVGITRDKTLAKMNSDSWNSVISVNLSAPQMLAQALFGGGKLHDNGQAALPASTSGVADNLGQSNYAVSKTGLIGLAQTWTSALGKRGTTINAVVPGLVRTQMTAAIPLVIRKAGRCVNSMGQDGLPQNVVETVAWFAQPSSGVVSGQVLKVCG